MDSLTTRLLRRNGVPGAFDALFGDFFGNAPAAPAGWVPALDLRETDEAYVVTLDLPGVETGDIDLSLVEDRLEIRGSRALENRTTEQGWHRVERRTGSFERVIRLPSSVDRERIEARSRNGVLEIRLPKRDENRTRKIEIRPE